MIKIIVFVLLAVIALSVLAQYRYRGTRWENVNDYPEFFSSQTALKPDDGDESGVEMRMREGFLYVKTDHTVNVKVVNVLGSTVSETVLEAGTSRMPLQTRGIYIVRAGKCARRVRVN